MVMKNGCQVRTQSKEILISGVDALPQRCGGSDWFETKELGQMANYMSMREASEANVTNVSTLPDEELKSRFVFLHTSAFEIMPNDFTEVKSKGDGNGTSGSLYQAMSPVLIKNAILRTGVEHPILLSRFRENSPTTTTSSEASQIDDIEEGRFHDIGEWLQVTVRRVGGAGGSSADVLREEGARTMEAAMNTPLQRTQEGDDMLMWKLDVIHTSSESEPVCEGATFVWSFCHSISDQTSVNLMFGSFMRNLSSEVDIKRENLLNSSDADASKVRFVTRPPHWYPSIEEAIPSISSTFRQFITFLYMQTIMGLMEYIVNRFIRGKRLLPSSARRRRPTKRQNGRLKKSVHTRGSNVVCCSLDEATSRALKAEAKRRGVTLNSIIKAVYLREVAREYSEGIVNTENVVRVVCQEAIDLRRYVQGEKTRLPVQLGFFAGFVTTNVAFKSGKCLGLDNWRSCSYGDRVHPRDTASTWDLSKLLQENLNRKLDVTQWSWSLNVLDNQRIAALLMGLIAMDGGKKIQQNESITIVDTKNRDPSAALTNAGLWKGGNVGQWKLTGIFFAQSQHVMGQLHGLACATIGKDMMMGSMCFTHFYCDEVWSRKEAQRFLLHVKRELETVAKGRTGSDAMLAAERSISV